MSKKIDTTKEIDLDNIVRAITLGNAACNTLVAEVQRLRAERTRWIALLNDKLVVRAGGVSVRPIDVTACLRAAIEAGLTGSPHGDPTPQAPCSRPTPPIISPSAGEKREKARKLQGRYIGMLNMPMSTGERADVKALARAKGFSAAIKVLEGLRRENQRRKG